MPRYSAFNLTKHVLIASDIEAADSCWRRMKGLIGRSAREFSVGQGLWIMPCKGIHTIGMSFPIDVVYLDETCHVLCLYHRLVPFRLAALKLKARSVLELAAGTLSDNGTTIGDKLEIRPSNYPGD